MARLARIVVPGYPHHITQRDNRRQPTFFCDEIFGDVCLYLLRDLLENKKTAWATSACGG